MIIVSRGTARIRPQKESIQDQTKKRSASELAMPEAVLPHRLPVDQRLKTVDQDISTRAAFRAFLLLSVIIFIAPQAYLSWLIPLQTGKIFSGLAIILYLLAVSSQGRKFTHGSSSEKWLLILICLEFVSIPLSRWPGGSLEFMIDMSLKCAVVFFLAANLLNSPVRIRKLFWCFLIFAIWNAGIGMKAYLGDEFLSYGRISGAIAPLTANPNDLALFLNMMLPIICYLYGASPRRMVKMICLGAMFLSIATIVITFSRGGFVTLVIMATFFVWRKARTHGPGVLIGAALAGILFITLAPGGYGNRVLSIADSSLDETGSSAARTELMKAAIASMIHHPLGIGVGMNVLSSVDAGQSWTVVHNAYLEIGVELGIVGMIVYILLIRKTMKGLGVLSKTYADRELAAMAEAVQLSLIAFCVAAFFHPVAHNFYFYYLGGLAVAIKYLARASVVPSHDSLPSAKPFWLRRQVTGSVARS